MKTQRGWRDATLPGNINILPQKDVTSIWKQTSSFRITMGRSVAQ